jgi:NAD+ synthase
MYDMVDKIKDDCVQWIKSWFLKNGHKCNAIVGISGGIDSSVVAALCVEALGKNRVIGVLMPNGVQSDIEYAYKLVNHLGIENIEINIKDSVDNIKNQIENVSEQTIINLPARIRMSTLYAVSQSNNGRVANTCNLSEDYIGYSTRYGDSVGDFSPLAKFTKSEVLLLASKLGLPKELIEKVPTDGLSGKTDEENFGFTYEQLDSHIRNHHFYDSSEVYKKIAELHEKNKFKLEPMDFYEFKGYKFYS